MADSERSKPGPFSATLGFRLISVDEDEAVVEGDRAASTHAILSATNITDG